MKRHICNKLKKVEGIPLRVVGICRIGIYKCPKCGQMFYIWQYKNEENNDWDSKRWNLKNNPLFYRKVPDYEHKLKIGGTK